MCWQETICKPDTLLGDKKSDFGLTEEENTWRISNPPAWLTCHLRSAKVVYQCQGQQAATPPLYQASVCCSLTLWSSESFSLGVFVYFGDRPGAIRTPASPVTMIGNLAGPGLSGTGFGPSCCDVAVSHFLKINIRIKAKKRSITKAHQFPEFAQMKPDISGRERSTTWI